MIVRTRAMVHLFRLLVLSLSLKGSDGKADNEGIGDTGIVICPNVAESTNDLMLMADDPTDPNQHRFNEISGLVFSRNQKGPSGDPIFYAVNDSGGDKRLGVYDSGTGERLLTLRLSTLASSRDWESLTIGSCGKTLLDEKDRATKLCIYIADVGDNHARGTKGAKTGRPNEPTTMFKVQEPLWQQFEENEEIPESFMTSLQFDYMHPDSPTPYADCEAVFLDHASDGDLYLLSKWSEGEAQIYNRLFLIPPDAWLSSETSFSAIPVTDGSSSLMGQGWTRAEMSFDGSLLVLGSYDDSYLFARCPDQNVARVFDEPFCRRWYNTFSSDARQFETIAIVPNGTRVLQISECRPKCNPPMVWTTLDYESGTAMCGPTAQPTTMEPSTSPVAPAGPPSSPPTPETQSPAPSKTDALFPSSRPSLAPSGSNLPMGPKDDNLPGGGGPPVKSGTNGVKAVWGNSALLICLLSFFQRMGM